MIMRGEGQTVSAFAAQCKNAAGWKSRLSAKETQLRPTGQTPLQDASTQFNIR